MRVVICENCRNNLAMMNGINCRVAHVSRTEEDIFIKLECVLKVWCAECGSETKVTLIHHFYKNVYETIPNKVLVQMVLTYSGCYYDD